VRVCACARPSLKAMGSKGKTTGASEHPEQNKHLQEATPQAFTQYTRERDPNGKVTGRFLYKLVGNRTKHQGFTKG